LLAARWARASAGAHRPGAKDGHVAQQRRVLDDGAVRVEEHPAQLGAVEAPGDVAGRLGVGMAQDLGRSAG
jgi:hypothetical protein